MPEWTKEQENAINTFGGNILVSAAAGSGKTAILVQRVIKKITDKTNPVDIDKLLIVTFTNAAAAEMKERISIALSDMIDEKTNDYNLQKQLSLLPSAQISTIDAFCINLVRENFYKLDIQQDFNLLDESEIELLENQAIEIVLEKEYKEKSPEFLSLVQLLSSPKNDENFANAIKKLYRYMNSQPFPFQWLNVVSEYFNPSIDMKDTNWFKTISKECSELLCFCKNLINEMKKTLDFDDKNKEKNEQMLQNDLKIINTVESLLSDKDKLYDYINNIMKFSTLPRGSLLKGKRAVYKDIITKKITPLVCVTQDEHKSDMQVIYPEIKCLCNIEKEFHNESMKLKVQKNAFTFQDIEHFALMLLVENKDGNIVKTELANSLSNNYNEILIDEYQDTNRAQDMLFEKLSNGKNLFMVGDVKQSIYRFRLAMPEIFVEKRNLYNDFSSKEFPKKIILDKNFRSKKGICDYVNFVFSSFMSQSVGGVNYDKSEYLNYGAKYENESVCSAQIKIFDKVATGTDFDINDATAIANYIKDKIASHEKIKTKNGYRDIKYSDIAILLRSTTKHIPAYLSVFKDMGIPVVSQNSDALFSNYEVRLIVEFLKVIDNPMQDIPLLSVMMSPLFGFSADDIAKIKIEGKQASFFTSVFNYNSEKVVDFKNKIQHFRDISATTSVAYLIRKIIDESFLIPITSSDGDSEQIIANISKFIEIAEKYDNSSSRGLTAFMRYVDSVSSSNGIKNASITSSKVDSVSIMSVHHSKGLEFPIVILAGATRKYNKSDSRESLLLSNDYGIGVMLHDEENLYRCKTLPYVSVATCINNDSISENLRVLYVAMTRAKEQFVAFVTGINIEKRLSTLSSKITCGGVEPCMVKTIDNDADLVLLSALLHPSGVKLRNLIGADIDVKSADFDIDIDFIEENDIETELDEDNLVMPDDELVQKIDEKMNFKYKFDNLSSISAKRNASELDEIETDFNYFAKSRPAFLNSSGLTPSEKGSAMHSFMQYCNYSSSKSNLELEINRLVDNNFISKEQADSLSIKKLKSFFNGDFAKRIFESKNVYREIKISSFLKASDIENTDCDDKVLVQGIADCVFEENDKLIIVDYKTDSVKDGEELEKRYIKQLSFYKMSVEKSLNKPVSDVYLYSFALDRAIRLNIL